MSGFLGGKCVEADELWICPGVLFELALSWVRDVLGDFIIFVFKVVCLLVLVVVGGASRGID